MDIEPERNGRAQDNFKTGASKLKSAYQVGLQASLPSRFRPPACCALSRRALQQEWVSKTHGAADWCRRQTVKQNLSAYFGSYIFSTGSSLRARPTPACPAYPGVKCVSVQVAMFDGQTVLPLSSSSPSNRETVRAGRTPRHCHHPPGIRNSPSESYAGRSTDRLSTRLRTWCTSLLILPARPTPACPAYPGGQLC